MFQLTYHEENPEVADITERLEKLSVAHSVQKEKNVRDITLTEGDTLIIGYNKIRSFLDDLEDELQKWYYCSC